MGASGRNLQSEREVQFQVALIRGAPPFAGNLKRRAFANLAPDAPEHALSPKHSIPENTTLKSEGECGGS